jgi:hypothetical protein
MFLSPNRFSQLKLFQDLKLGVNRREERGFWVLGGTSLKFLVEWNEWAMVRSEGRAIYTQDYKLLLTYIENTIHTRSKSLREGQRRDS